MERKQAETIKKNHCNSCLWAGCECKNKEKYEPEANGACRGWTYYD